MSNTRSSEEEFFWPKDTVNTTVVPVVTQNMLVRSWTKFARSIIKTSTTFGEPTNAVYTRLWCIMSVG